MRRQYPEGLPIIMLSGHDDEASVLRGLQVIFF
jgi:DNA-binding response OmpR family regulator